MEWRYHFWTTHFSNGVISRLEGSNKLSFKIAFLFLFALKHLSHSSRKQTLKLNRNQSTQKTELQDIKATRYSSFMVIYLLAMASCNKKKPTTQKQTPPPKKKKTSHITERRISSLQFKNFNSDLYKTTLLLNMSGLKAFQYKTGHCNWSRITTFATMEGTAREVEKWRSSIHQHTYFPKHQQSQILSATKG